MRPPISRYRLVRTIASGGMAHIYEAVAQGERGFERRVAIKRILPQHAADERMQRMFFDEASIASRLHHANIVQVLDFGVLEGDDFLVMEFVDGLDAARAVQLASDARQPIPEALALHVVSEIAHALAYAHGLRDEAGEPLGIIHRDVSPHNILLSWDGDVKLADFGIALARGREHRTQAGVVKGKLSFMPQEQAEGRALTGAVDVYALGATLHALVSGTPPREHPHAVVRLDESLSEPFLALVDECTSDDPASRPSAERLAERAGRLAHAGLDRDARGALRAWLAGRREPEKRSALDDLMGMVLVASDGGRRFTVSRLETMAHGEAPSPDSLPPASHEWSEGGDGAPVRSDAPVELPVRSRVPLIAGLALIGLALAAGGLGFFASGGDPGPREEVADTEPTTPDAGGAVEALAEGPRARPAPPVEIAEPTPAPSAPGSPVARVRGHRPPPPSSAEETTSAPPPHEAPVEAVAAADAYLRIPRAGATAERVRIDGTPRGFTPAVVRVAAGPHRVALEDTESGETIFEREVRPGAQHTRLSPLVVER